MSENDILNFALSIAGAAAGIYGAVRAWMSNRKMKQIEVEKLSSKLNVDFSYELIHSGETNICKGVIRWTNLGLTNIKIIKLNIDIRDREDELSKSYIPPEGTGTPFISLAKKIGDFELVAVNNHKLVNFSKDSRKGEVKVFQDDPIYGLELTSRQKRLLKESGEEVEIDILKIKNNIARYIDNKITKLKDIFLNKEREDFGKNLAQFLFVDTMVKELRGIQLFPQESKDQEFFLKYQGEGIVYLNVESATIRLQLKNITAIEQYKTIADEILDAEDLSDILIGKFRKLLTAIISPTSLDIHKHKSNYLIYLK